MDRNTFILLYKCLVRPHLEYANLMSPRKKGVIEDVEKIQKRATILVFFSKTPLVQRPSCSIRFTYTKV